MKKIKSKLTSSYYAIFYQFVCVPLLAILSILIYSTLVVDVDYSYPILNAVVLTVLIAANISLIYFIALFFIKKGRMALIYHIIVGAITTMGVMWLNVYYNTIESVSCSDYSALACADSIVNGKTAMLCLIACVSYYLIYIFIHKIVQSKVGKAIS